MKVTLEGLANYELRIRSGGLSKAEKIKMRTILRKRVALWATVKELDQRVATRLVGERAQTLEYCSR